MENVTSLSDNLYIFSQVEVKNNKAKFSINKDVSDSIINLLISYINNSTFNNIKFVCRSDKEPFSKSYPTKKQIQNIVQTCKKTNRIFYQEPWPNKVPNFSEDSLVIRFGYDEGHTFDKSCADGKLVDFKKQDGSYYYLVGNHKLIEIKKLLL